MTYKLPIPLNNDTSILVISVKRITSCHLERRRQPKPKVHFNEWRHPREDAATIIETTNFLSLQ